MRRYILIDFPAWNTGQISCTVDSLDDIIGDDMEAIDTHTGDTYYYDAEWIKDKVIDEIQASCLRRKSDPPPVVNPQAKEVEGGILVPPGFVEAVLTETLVSTK